MPTWFLLKDKQGEYLPPALSSLPSLGKHKLAGNSPCLPNWFFLNIEKVMDPFSPLTCLAVAIPAIGAQYSMFQAAPAPKMIEDGKIHAMEHMISPIAVQPDPASAAAAAAAAAAAVIPAVSTPPPFQVEFLPRSVAAVCE